MKKYVFKPYSKIFPELFAKEKARIASHINLTLAIEHVGSTAVPGLGGKGIIDIAISANKQDLETVKQRLEELGYEFRAAFSTDERLYFIIYLPDPEDKARRYHVHLMPKDSKEWQEFIQFRDTLRSDPQAAQEYAVLKQQAAAHANQDGESYRAHKKPMFKKILGSREYPNHQ